MTLTKWTVLWMEIGSERKFLATFLHMEFEKKRSVQIGIYNRGGQLNVWTDYRNE